MVCETSVTAYETTQKPRILTNMAAVPVGSESCGNLDECCTFLIKYSTYIETQG
jgi:hypothetical protein